MKSILTDDSHSLLAYDRTKEKTAEMQENKNKNIAVVVVVVVFCFVYTWKQRSRQRLRFRSTRWPVLGPRQTYYAGSRSCPTPAPPRTQNRGEVAAAAAPRGFLTGPLSDAAGGDDDGRGRRLLLLPDRRHRSQPHSFRPPSLRPALRLVSSPARARSLARARSTSVRPSATVCLPGRPSSSLRRCCPKWTTSDEELRGGGGEAGTWKLTDWDHFSVTTSVAAKNNTKVVI